MTNTNPKYDILRQRNTLAHDGDRGTEWLIEHLSRWEGRYGIMLSDAGHNRVMVELATVPDNINEFAAEVYSICPDVVTEYFTSFTELANDNPNPNYAKSIEGLDEMDDDFGLKAMKRWIVLERKLPLYWS